MILNFEAGNNLTGLNIKQSTADPIAIDMGNINTQGRVVSKTIQLAMFTNNRNAIWAGSNMLRRLSYPFATIEVPVNRNLFRQEVGDCILFSYPPYNIVNKIYRIVSKQEDDPTSEVIKVTLIEDLYSIVNIDDGALANFMLSVTPPDFTALPFTYIKVLEMPYGFSSEIAVLAIAAKVTGLETGFQIYRSLDGGTSYALLSTVEKNFVIYGTLNGAYSIDAPHIDEAGITVTIERDDDDLETSTFTEIFAGTENIMVIDNEIMAFEAITPITSTTFALTNVIRARYGTLRADHADESPVWIMPTSDVELVTSSGFVYDAECYFKLVPYNIKETGALADAVAASITILNKNETPYPPVNFDANGASYAARYDDDIVLTWSARKRGEGAGIGTPGTVLPTTGHEGYFEVKVYVNELLVRTTTDIDAVTWTYTEAMNLADNTSLASSVTFTICNFRTVNSIRHESEWISVTCKKN